MTLTVNPAGAARLFRAPEHEAPVTRASWHSSDDAWWHLENAPAMSSLRYNRFPRPFWSVGCDNECVAFFDSEPAALVFAQVDSQLEGVTAVVVRHDEDGTATMIAEFVR